MARALNREELLRQFAAEPAIVKAALKVVEQHVKNSARPCDCASKAVQTARYSYGGYADGGAISEECMGADDPAQCEEDRRQRHQEWNNFKSRLENGAMDWAEGKIRDKFNIRPGSIAAMQGRGGPGGGFPAGALAGDAALAGEGAALGAEGLMAGAGAAEAGAAGLAGLEGLEFLLPLLGLL